MLHPCRAGASVRPPLPSAARLALRVEDPGAGHRRGCDAPGAPAGPWCSGPTAARRRRQRRGSERAPLRAVPRRGSVTCAVKHVVREAAAASTLRSGAAAAPPPIDTGGATMMRILREEGLVDEAPSAELADEPAELARELVLEYHWCVLLPVHAVLSLL